MLLSLPPKSSKIFSKKCFLFSIFSGCSPEEFECFCGEPRCVPKSLVHNGLANCADASDELEQLTDGACPDGTPAKNSNLTTSQVRLCASRRSCNEAMGQVCVVS